MSRSMIALGVLIAVGFAILSSVFIVDERKKALVLQFGEVKKEITEPGLNVRIPFIQEVVFYDDRILPLNTQSLEVTPLDDRRLVVDAFARWRIESPSQFRRAVGTGGEEAGARRLGRILNAQLREVLGSVNSGAVLSAERVLLMNKIRDQAKREAKTLGIDVIDVRIKRADLPTQNLEATFERMRAEREREAADEIARGNEAAQRVRASADRLVVETTSKAQKESDIIRGEADGRRNAVFAEAFGRDPEFFAFYRSLSAYEAALKGSNSQLVISPDSEFFDYLKSDAVR